MNALIKFVMFLIAAGVLPVLSGLLPVSLLPADKRRFPLIVLGGYLSVFALFEWIGLPVLIWTASGDFGSLTPQSPTKPSGPYFFDQIKIFLYGNTVIYVVYCSL